MRVGIVSMYDAKDQIEELTHVISSLGARTYVIQGQREAEVIRAIHKEKDIHHWIFSGSDTVVTHHLAPQVPLELLMRTDKTFLMICYSMESVLVQLGFPIKRRSVNKRGPLPLSVKTPYRAHPLFSAIAQPMLIRRNHRFYFPMREVGPPVVPIASYDGELMMALYKNTVLTQYHPERSNDGRQFIQNWLSLV
jgi:GMP synthase-like glutamine amidotransferase